MAFTHVRKCLQLGLPRLLFRWISLHTTLSRQICDVAHESQALSLTALLSLLRIIWKAPNFVARHLALVIVPTGHFLHNVLQCNPSTGQYTSELHACVVPTWTLDTLPHPCLSLAVPLTTKTPLCATRATQTLLSFETAWISALPWSPLISLEMKFSELLPFPGRPLCFPRSV